MSSANHLAFRQEFYIPESIINVSDFGIQHRTRFSRHASLWLDWMEDKENVKIRREVYVGNKFYADGYLDRIEDGKALSFLPGVEGRIIFEFLVSSLSLAFPSAIIRVLG